MTQSFVYKNDPDLRLCVCSSFTGDLFDLLCSEMNIGAGRCTVISSLRVSLSADDFLFLNEAHCLMNVKMMKRKLHVCPAPAVDNEVIPSLIFWEYGGSNSKKFFINAHTLHM